MLLRLKTVGGEERGAVAAAAGLLAKGIYRISVGDCDDYNDNDDSGRSSGRRGKLLG